MGMILGHLKRVAETNSKTCVKGAVVAVPAFYSQKQRTELMKAAKIAGFSETRLMNEQTATALAFGWSRAHLFSNGPKVSYFTIASCDEFCYILSG